MFECSSLIRSYPIKNSVCLLRVDNVIYSWCFYVFIILNVRGRTLAGRGDIVILLYYGRSGYLAFLRHPSDLAVRSE